MREIKYRAWSVDGEVMLYSDFNAYGFYTKEDPEHISEQTETIFMYHAHTGDRDFVLMQYTGLKDKNGVEIYEGDIIERMDWDELVLGKVERDIDGTFLLIEDRGTTFLGPLLEIVEIVGNIYEHPHLLEGTLE